VRQSLALEGLKDKQAIKVGEDQLVREVVKNVKGCWVVKEELVRVDSMVLLDHQVHGE